MAGERASGWRLLTVVLVAGGTAWLVTRLAGPPIDADEGRGPAVSEADFHQWMHERLDLSAAQHERLEPVERAFERRREELRGEIAAAGRELAAAVREGDPKSPRIEAALRRLNEGQAALQQATLEHFFAMKEHLDPEQAERLLEWTHDSLVHE